MNKLLCLLAVSLLFLLALYWLSIREGRVAWK